jgi:hypothetical protein
MAVLAFVAWAQAEEPAAKGKIRVLVTVGGHGFDEKGFAAKFGKMPDIEYTRIQMPQQAKMLRPGLEKDYDVIVMFDWAKTSAEDNKSFGELLQQVAFTVQYGKCRVFHCMLGHGAEAWNNPAFTDVLDRAVCWAARRLPAE